MACGLALASPSKAPPEIASTDAPSLSGGDIASDVVDMKVRQSIGEERGNGSTEAQPETTPEGDSDLLKGGGDVGLYATSGRQCATPTGPVPAPGWTLTYGATVAECSYPYTSGYYSVCFGAAHYCFNQVEYTSYNDVPLGGTLRFCSVIGVPSGWSVTQVGLPSSCGGSGEDWVMKHVSCQPSDTNCSVTPPSGAITANPTTLYLAGGQVGSTTLSWTSANTVGSLCVWIRGNSSAMGCGGASGSLVPNWIHAGDTFTFDLRQSSGNVLLSSVTVRAFQATGTLTASPATLYLPAGAVGTSTISWNAPGQSSIGIWVSANGAAYTPWISGGASGSRAWSYLHAGDTHVFQLRAQDSTTVLATTTVKALAAATISANPAVLTIPNGQVGTSTISWNAPGQSSIGIWVSANGAAYTPWISGGTSGSRDWPYLHAGDTHVFQLRAQDSTTVLATTTVTAHN